jgi:hypothetical protein
MRLVALVVALACAILGCEIEVPLVDPPPDAGNDGGFVPDAAIGDDGGGAPDSASSIDGGSTLPADAATFD